MCGAVIVKVLWKLAQFIAFVKVFCTSLWSSCCFGC